MSNFADRRIPLSLRLLPDFTDDLSALGELLAPDQLMVSEIPRILAEGAPGRHSYVAFPIARLCGRTRKPQISAHDRPAGEWRDRMTVVLSSRTVSSQSYVLYLVGFSFLLTW